MDDDSSLQSSTTLKSSLMLPTSSIEEELWRIFTFYGLHGDSSTAYQWRLVNLVRFARDSQIISDKFTSQQLELEIIRLMREKRKAEAGVSAEDKKSRSSTGNNSTRDFDSSSTIVIHFPDFLLLLEIIAPKVYPNENKQISLRRLLLENVLLLSNRRKPINVDPVEMTNTEAISTVRQKYNKSLFNIFHYYLSKADKRRSKELANESVKMGTVGFGNRQQTKAEKIKTMKFRERMRHQKDLIGYTEFYDFCHDFKLKSRNLLTALQVGEIFFECVSYNNTTKLIDGMDFDAFLYSLHLMAVVAYKHCHSSVTANNKVKALLLFMWRAVNQGDTHAKATSNKDMTAGSSHAGSLNIFGAGIFSDHFLKCWTLEGFTNYASPVAIVKDTGLVTLKKILSRDYEPDSNKSVSLVSMIRSEKKEKEGEENAADDKEDEGPQHLYGFQLSALLATRPELAEMIVLEMRNHKFEHELIL